MERFQIQLATKLGNGPRNRTDREWLAESYASTGVVAKDPCVMKSPSQSFGLEAEALSEREPV
jgi:hypothetical protein